MILPVDNEQRLAALNPLHSVCVTAPAGSGKTELLSQRVLKLLASADQPEDILAITFTRKAAAEMHHRIIDALRFAASSPEPEQAHKKLTWQLARDALDRDQQCQWHLLENTGRLKVQTIDSLCASLTRQMPILSNFGAQPQVSDSSQRLYQMAVHNFLQQLEQNTYFADDLMLLMAHVDNDMAKAERLLIGLLQRRDQWLIHIGISSDPETAKEKLELSLQQLISDVLEQLYSELLAIAPELLPLLDYAGCNMQWQQSDSPICALAGIIELPANDPVALSQWRAIADMLLTQSNSWRKTVDKRAGFPTETQDGDKALAKSLKANYVELLKGFHDNDALLALLLELRHLPDAEFDQQQWQLLAALTRLLPTLVAQLTLVFQQQGEVDYSEISMAALQALGDGLSPTELAMKLDHQLCHILVDEFQDTASPQFRLLDRLLEGWSEYNSVNPEKPNTLFIVGDGMQSIYGFREANVGLFLEARAQGLNGVPLQDLPLTVNFRSDPAIVSWINSTFSQAFPLLENLSRGAVPFEHAEAFNASDSGSEITVEGFMGEDARLQEAERVVQLVQHSQAENPRASIAILVRNRSHLRDIIPALSRAGLSWNATDIDPLASYSPILDLLSLTKALFNTADRISWSALLRTPWLGLNNTDLHALLALSRRYSIWSSMQDPELLAPLSAHGRQRLNAVIPILSAAYQQRYRLSARSWVEGVWMALGGAAVVTSRSEFDFIDDYFELLENYQQGELLPSIDEFEQAVQRLYAAPQTTDSQLHVMTIHKAKGLEFDRVILPAMARQPRSDDKSLLMWREYLSADGHSSGLIMSPLGATGNEEDSIYRYLRFEQKQSTRLENTRLFYVAATRAIKQLHILLTAEKDSKTDLPKPPSQNSLLHSAWPVLEQQVQWTEAVADLKAEQFGLDFDQSSLSLQRLRANWVAPAWNFPNPLQDYYLNDEPMSEQGCDDLNIPQAVTDPLPQIVGTVSHWLFEVMVKQGVDCWLEKTQQQQQQWLQALLHYHNLPELLWPQAIEQITRSVDNTLTDAKGRWLFAPEHSQSLAELSLLSTVDGSVRSNSIDRCFIDAANVLWIVDYKTSSPQDNESKRDFVAREIEHYQHQLAHYKKLLSARLEQQLVIKTALYFTYYPYWCELDL
ncbi:UvrD-helicase domain-containing protein [Oceanicoccus sagamiensis]|uniref:DNA 3'-5' helicase n=1 Tax=Oceanicoccus sagamiensis TaxID=716816 RepID=A0A1X9NM08_9GAMM|nr:UvrD-helicase domain-containing protein [Oceanicoccus sagamiensis]ARN75867.1 hypothetical protein BST96_18215 [Oceanicoccus sagamiensis]